MIGLLLLVLAAGPSDDDCLACHDGVSLGASIHGQAGLSCVDCHDDLAGLTDFPHQPRLAPPNCRACHDGAAAKHAAGVHARALTAGRKGAGCTDCHGAGHAILPASDPRSPTSHFRVPHTCAQCHSQTRGGLVSRFEDSIHGHALVKSGLKVAPNCVTCHAAHEIRDPRDPEAPVHRTQIPKTCGSCHAGILPVYEDSVHGKAVAGGDVRAAICTDCHSAHEVVGASVPAWKLEVIRECGTCHGQSLKTYRDGFHGQVTALGFTRVAACADCHGSHDILPASDSRSKVARANLVRTCGRRGQRALRPVRSPCPARRPAAQRARLLHRPVHEVAAGRRVLLFWAPRGVVVPAGATRAPSAKETA